MTVPLFREDAYVRKAVGVVKAVDSNGGVILDQSLFYPSSGGQPGDAGTLRWDGGDMPVQTTVKGDGNTIILIRTGEAMLPPVGTEVCQEIDWDLRYQHMRVHTALHLLSVVIALPVTGGQISAIKGRLDFAMPEAIEDKGVIADALNALIFRDLEISETWIGQTELDANPKLVKTMSVQPPRNAGRVRLVRIGTEHEQVDLQPCGGTHVARTPEIGRMRLGKVEKKGRLNRRVYIHFEDS